MNQVNILVVDDDEIDRLAIKRYLARGASNMNFYEAETAEQADSFLSGREFDCIFLDYSLPDADGISLLKKHCNKETGMLASPTVMLTGQGSEAVMIDAIHWGAQDYLVKDNISRDMLRIAITKAQKVFELKRSELLAAERLRQAQKMEAVGQLTSGVAHDFNNILGVVLGNLQFLRKNFSKLISGINEQAGNDFKRKIDSMEAVAQRGVGLIERLMIFTRQSVAESKVVDLNTYIKNLHELLQRTLEKNIDVKLNLSDTLHLVNIDVSQFESALINLALNARDAMPNGGLLTIETRNITLDDGFVKKHSNVRAGDYVLMTVSDTGEGIPPKLIKRIFEPFFTTKPVGKGTGLGLSMVYGFIKQTRGYIHVDSNEGKGTKFHIYLPEYCGKDPDMGIYT